MSKSPLPSPPPAYCSLDLGFLRPHLRLGQAWRCPGAATPRPEARCSSQGSPGQLPLAAILRVRAGFSAQPHSPSVPSGLAPDCSAPFSASTVELPPFPPTCTNRREALPPALSPRSQCPGPGTGAAPVGWVLSVAGLGSFLRGCTRLAGRSGGSSPVWLGAVFPSGGSWPSFHGPAFRTLGQGCGVGSFRFHVGSQQEGLSCGCQLDSRAQPRGLAGPEEGEL